MPKKQQNLSTYVPRSFGTIMPCGLGESVNPTQKNASGKNQGQNKFKVTLTVTLIINLGKVTKSHRLSYFNSSSLFFTSHTFLCEPFFPVNLNGKFSATTQIMASQLYSKCYCKCVTHIKSKPILAHIKIEQIPQTDRQTGWIQYSLWL